MFVTNVTLRPCSVNWDTVSQAVNDFLNPVIQPNLPENFQISTLFRTKNPQKVLMRVQLTTYKGNIDCQIT